MCGEVSGHTDARGRGRSDTMTRLEPGGGVKQEDSVQARLDRMELPFNAYGVDPYGVSKWHLGVIFELMNFSAMPCASLGGSISRKHEVTIIAPSTATPPEWLPTSMARPRAGTCSMPWHFTRKYCR